MRDKIQYVKDKIRTFICFFLYGSLNRKDFLFSTNQIRSANLKTLKIVSLCLFLIHLSVTVSYYYLDILRFAIPLYFSVTAVSFAVYLCAKTILKKHLAIILPVYYSYQILLYAYSIYLGIYINTKDFALILCILLFSIPVMTLDRPVRVSILSLITTVIFCIMAVQLKKDYNLAGDITNALGCCICGLIIFYHVLNIKMNDIAMKVAIEHERDTDSLTGLYNKKATEARITAAIRNTPDAGAFLILDLDDFKYINDTYGHQTGDNILSGLGFCISNIFEKSDICGRFGGDEFIIFMTGTKDKSKIEHYASSLQRFIHNEIVFSECTRTVNCSIGISVMPDDATDYYDLLVKADKALYKAKKSGKNKFCFYSPALEKESDF